MAERQGDDTPTGDEQNAQRQEEKANNDNRSNQDNPNHPEYRGHQPGYGGDGTQSDRDNHSVQLNTAERQVRHDGENETQPLQGPTSLSIERKNSNMAERQGNTPTGDEQQQAQRQEQANRDNTSNQDNPNNPNFQGHQPGYGGDGTQADRDNHSDQLNPNNDKFQEKK